MTKIQVRNEDKQELKSLFFQITIMQKLPYPTAISATSRCLAERRDPSVAVQNTYSGWKGMETQDTTIEIALLAC